ncbi:MAG TPA: dihydroorotate dehydrogenase, partial [Bacteroidales bacterium]|nr:dihydroorotate dehydrogenase [Bacteroidales bacterium]
MFIEPTAAVDIIQGLNKYLDYYNFKSASELTGTLNI